MSTFYSAGSHQSSTIRVGGSSLNYLSSNPAPPAEPKKNAILYEVDSELKRLRYQLDSAAKGDNSYGRTSIP